jgi:ASC-1-like (ASCH) protein
MKPVNFFDDKIMNLAQKLSNISNNGQLPLTGKEAKAVIKELEAYKMCRDYLKSNPSEEFIKSEIARLEAFNNQKLEVFDNMYDKSKIAQPLYTKLRGDYEKKWQIPKNRNQLHWLRLLL